MHTNEIIYALICISNHVLSCLISMLSERLRYFLRECPHHGIPKHEITQIFYDGLGAHDQYLLDAASGGTFMSKCEDDPSS